MAKENIKVAIDLKHHAVQAYRGVEIKLHLLWICILGLGERG
jgi:hypothetical protein